MEPELSAGGAAPRSLLGFGDVDLGATVRDREVEGLADFHLRSDERSDELHPAIILCRYQYDYKVYDNGRGIERSIN